MKALLEKCEYADFEYLSKVLDSYLSFTDDNKRKQLLDKSKSNNAARTELILLIDKQIRYYGSSDFAYLTRFLCGKDKNEAGVAASELIDDVCKKLKVPIKRGGSSEVRLERLVKAVVEKELLSKSPEELSKAFEDIGVGDADRDLIMDHLKKNGKAAVLPILFKVLGPKVTLGIIETIIVTILAQIVGREAAKHLVKELVKRNPWLNVLGPVLWVISGTWIALDLQGPAYRKTIPICLYLGIVALRDGSEE